MEEIRYTIQDLCDRTGLPRRTIHFYTGQELLPPPVGAGPGAFYTTEHLVRLHLIPLLRRQGLRLDEIRQKFHNLTPEDCARLLESLQSTSTPPPEPARAETFLHYDLPGGIQLIIPASLNASRRPQVLELLAAARQIFEPTLK
jgi:DNA-binding transcriptional MerR regulator